jgi:hypothetical protein
MTIKEKEKKYFQTFYIQKLIASRYQHTLLQKIKQKLKANKHRTIKNMKLFVGFGQIYYIDVS